MGFLIGCIICSSLLYLIFKGFEKYKVNLLQAIVVNYIVAGSLGFILAAINNQEVDLPKILKTDWFPFAILIGFMFITIFNLIGISSQKSGVAVTSVANKMSVVLPVMFGLLFLKEEASGLKITGISLALIALWLTMSKEKGEQQTNHLWLPVIIFFASGLLDILLGYCNEEYINKHTSIVFTASLFSFAAIFGLMFLLIQIVRGKEQVRGKNIAGGIILGIPNFCSIWLVFAGLNSTGWDVSVFFPVLNMGVVVMAAVLGGIIFRERLSLINIAGICMAVLAIYLIAFS